MKRLPYGQCLIGRWMPRYLLLPHLIPKYKHALAVRQFARIEAHYECHQGRPWAEVTRRTWGLHFRIMPRTPQQRHAWDGDPRWLVAARVARGAQS
jgi:hypothetical protein